MQEKNESETRKEFGYLRDTIDADDVPVFQIIQGRKVTAKDIGLIKRLMAENPDWHRTRLSKELCIQWDWQKPGGQLKDMSCRSLLLKLEKRGCIKLPEAAYESSKPYKNHSLPIPTVLHSKEPIDNKIKELYPIEIKLVESVEPDYDSCDLRLFKYFISSYHYLGWSGTVGENLKYLFFDRYQRPLGCMMFGAAAWKVQPRDNYIGWKPEIRASNLLYIANNNRYLLLPWVKVEHLASHILGKICRRLNQDWMKKYKHEIYLLETFVETEKFAGTCYKAANWINVGKTQGRGKLDVKGEYALPIKSIWLYPLTPSFRKKLGV